VIRTARICGRAWSVLAAFLLTLAIASPVTSVRAQPATGARLALVIGNAAYRDSPLRNPVNDARAIAATLTAAGFKVDLRENLSHRGMVEAIRTFGDTLRSDSMGLF